MNKLNDLFNSLKFRPVFPKKDISILYDWVTHKKSAFWMMQDFSKSKVLEEYETITNNPNHNAFFGLLNNKPGFLIEVYNPKYSELNNITIYTPRTYDLGIHFLCPHTEHPISGFTQRALLEAVNFVFQDKNIHRIIVEPDIRNTKVHNINSAVGFKIIGEAQLKNKKSLLFILSRNDFKDIMNSHLSKLTS